MEERRDPPKKVKVEVRPAPNSLKIILIILIVFSMAALVALRWVHNGIQDEITELKDEASAIEQANADLKERTKKIDSVQSIQDIAQEELGLVDPDTVVISPE